jgi:putative ABC transport system ATP-binding protein
MQVFEGLNRQGITIVLVTHEADVARHARRRIVFRDGKVVEDVPQVSHQSTGASSGFAGAHP